ncbi:hypothetical protein Trihar35433_2380 [Trichoderma harzianum]|nr:hypothetical protein Trihar35433_2380 [Trichoderma harzianum]
MEGLQRLKSLIVDERVSGLKDLVQDNYRFIQMFGNLIADFPLQVYMSGLLFSPAHSLTYKLFSKESPKFVQRFPQKEMNWNQYLKRFDGHTSFINFLDISCCGTWLASSSEDETIKIWEARTGRLIRSMKTHSTSRVSFSPWNSNEIASGGLHRDEIIVWDVVTGKMLQQIKLAETEFIVMLSLLPSVQNVLGCVSYTKDRKSMDISFYNTRTGDMTNLVNFPPTGREAHYLVAFSTKDSRILAVASMWFELSDTHGSEIKLYSLNTNNELQNLQCLTCPQTTAMGFSQSGHLIVVHKMSKSDCISMFDVATGATLWRSQIEIDRYYPYLALSRDGRLALCDWSKVDILDATTGQMLSTQQIEPGELTFPCEQGGNHIYVASQNVINVVELGSRDPSGKNLSKGHIGQLTTTYRSAVLSPDGRQLATLTREPVPMIVVCDTLFQKRTCIHRVHSFGRACALAFSPDSRKLACWLDGKLGVWDVSSESKTKTLLYHKHHCINFDHKLLFSEDGIYLAVACTSTGRYKGNIEIWNVDTSQRFIYLEVLKEQDESLGEISLAFSPSSKFLAFSWYDTERDVTKVEVWDVTSRKGVFSKSICGNDLKSSTRGSSLQTAPISSSQSATKSVRFKRLSFPDESHLILDMYHHGDIRVIFEMKQSSEPAEELNKELVYLRDSNDLTIDQSNSWINFRGEKLLWLPPEYRPDEYLWDIQQNYILITAPYEMRLFIFKLCCSACIGRAFTPGWQPGESTLCSEDAEAPVARPELSDSELEFLTMDPPDGNMMVFSTSLPFNMSAANPPKFIYKILPAAPQDPLPEQFPFSQLDANDGFVHLSTATQVPNTADLFFTEATELWLIKLELAKLADPLKWEDGFPHLYGNFGAADVQSLEKFGRKEGQKWSEGMKASSWLE